IDTNGSNPEVMKNLMPFIDRVALDMKSPLTSKRLEKIIQGNTDPKKIIETFNIINNAKEIDFEIRTTFVKNMLKMEDIGQIMKFLIKNNFRGNFVLQQYQYSEGVGKEYENKFVKPEHEELVLSLKPYQLLDLPFNLFLRDDIVGYCKVEKIIKEFDTKSVS
ncbi:MAG: hypothetical protein ACFFAO_21090, partial [Candidatus Hermodarchaeota archaeon]